MARQQFDPDETRVYREGLVNDGDTRRIPQIPQEQPGAYQNYQQPEYEDQDYYDQYDGDEDDDYYEDDYDNFYRHGEPTMAARAAGKSQANLYGRPAKTKKKRPQRDYPDQLERPRRKKRRKRHHGFRNFILFLLILAAIVGGIYWMLFRAPEQYTDGVHTRKSGFYNILLCATDEGEERTDTMMILTLDEKGKQVSLTSLPRDTITDADEWVPKLNAVYGAGGGGEAGAEALMDQVKTLLGFRPDGYLVINYQVFRDAVNALGGVHFDVPMDMTVEDPFTGEDTIIYAGPQVLNGDEALSVCRFRYGYLMADIQRQYVQQSFVKAMIAECKSPSNWMRLPGVYRAVMDNTITDLKDRNLWYLALHAYLAGLGDIPQNTLPGEGVDYNGSSCYGLYGQSVVDMVNEVMNPFEEELTIDDVYILTVEDGELVKSTWRGVAFDASTYDYNSYE